MGISKKIGPAWNRLYGKYVIPFLEKEETYKGLKLQYLLYPKKGAKYLAVGLQAYHPAGARYGYVTTLAGINAHRLYIKDDFGIQNGSYYLGHGGQYQIEEAVTQFILEQARRLGAEHIILFGSSKGGYAALNIGLNIPGSYIIPAAPQYRLGTYITKTKKFHPAFENFANGIDAEAAATELNAHIQRKLENNYQGQRLYIHYSPVEGGYVPYMKDLFEDLQRLDIPYEEDLGDYMEHNELKFYYPAWLRKTIERIIANGR